MLSETRVILNEVKDLLLPRSVLKNRSFALLRMTP